MTQETHTLTFTEFLSSHFQAKWAGEGNGSLSPTCIHPPKDFTKGKKDIWRRGLIDLMRWIPRGRDHIFGGLLSGGLIPEGEGVGPDRATKARIMDGNVGINGDRMVHPPGSGGTDGDLTRRSGSHPCGLRSWRVPHKGPENTGSTSPMVSTLRGTAHGDLPRLHGGSILVLCGTQDITQL
jgi:hypothetical protein